MMITLFIVQSCADPKDPSVTEKSFDGIADDVHCVSALSEVNGMERRNDWYGVFYDDEHIDEPLLEGLKVFIRESDADMLVLLKKNGEHYFKSPRLFRRHITLRDGSLLPESGSVPFQTVLNGWVLPND